MPEGKFAGYPLGECPLGIEAQANVGIEVKDAKAGGEHRAWYWKSRDSGEIVTGNHGFSHEI